MSEIVEKVARAIEPHFDDSDFENSGPGWNQCLAAARAAILAMRLPDNDPKTTEFIGALLMDPANREVGLRASFNIVIDAALK